jgi:hypothetical protein
MIIWKNFKTLERYSIYNSEFEDSTPIKYHIFYIKNIKNYNIKPNDIIKYKDKIFKIFDTYSEYFSNLTVIYCTIEN